MQSTNVDAQCVTYLLCESEIVNRYTLFIPLIYLVYQYLHVFACHGYE
jgi:hypothetical protein